MSAALLALAAKFIECGVTIDWLNTSALEFVVAVVERGAGFGEFLQAGFGRRAKVDFHGLSLERLLGCVKSPRFQGPWFPPFRETAAKGWGTPRFSEIGERSVSAPFFVPCFSICHSDVSTACPSGRFVAVASAEKSPRRNAARAHSSQ